MVKLPVFCFVSSAALTVSLHSSILAVPSAGTPFFSGNHTANSLTSFKALLKCHLSKVYYDYSI